MALTPAQNEQITECVRETLARRRISRRKLAAEARISVSTLEKALAGDRPFSLASVLRLEQVLGVNLRSAAQSSAAETSQIAPKELGEYVRSAVAWLEGEYLTLRPSFDPPGAILAYCTRVAWDEGRHCLQFVEAERYDSENIQTGLIALPAARGKVYFSTVESGQMRLAILNSPTRRGELAGLLLTLTAGPPGMPVTTPIVLVERKAEHQCGRFVRSDAPFARYQSILAEARKAVHLHDVPA